jgi:hypothetical protein
MGKKERRLRKEEKEKGRWGKQRHRRRGGLRPSPAARRLRATWPRPAAMGERQRVGERE